jgi:preprotein translocase subunit SecE
MAEKELNVQQEATSKKEEKAAAKAAKAAAKAAANADSKKSGKKKEEKKKNIFSRLAGWFKDLKKEFKKVVWPERKKVVNNTLVVLAVVVIGSVLVGLIDSGLLRLMQYLMGLSN